MDSRCLFKGRGKSGLHRRGYQRKAGGRKATESVTESSPLVLITKQVEMPVLRTVPDLR